LQERGEKHHVVPLSLGGNKRDIAKLTYREHFLCHWLLTKFTAGADRQKMLCALWRMRHINGRYDRPVSSWQYAVARRATSEATSLRNKGNKYSAGRKWTDEQRKRHGEIFIGRPIPQWQKERLRIIHTGTKASAATRKKMSASQALRMHSEESKRKISAGNSGKVRTPEMREVYRQHRLGMKASEETRRRMSEARLRYFAKQKENAL
jgi:NUMOD3 motif